VLGCSSKLEQAVEEELAIEDGIPVYRRPSGGESMFLSPQMAVISLVLDLEGRPLPRTLFKATGEALIRAMESLGIRDVVVRGTSDLAIGERKILGSAIYQRGSRLFYHAVLNVAEESKRIQRYLRHPVREPKYREGRRHEDFITSLNGAGYSISPEDCRGALAEAFAHSPLG
jgi:lipoate-protein ligase A